MGNNDAGNKPVRTVAVYGCDRQEAHLPELGVFFARLRAEGIRVYVFDGFATWLCNHGIDLCGAECVSSLPDDALLVASVGGDGTFLHAVAWIDGRDIPVMGINTGHLGYLAGFSFSRMEEVLAAIGGSGEESSRMMLEVAADSRDGGFRGFALNEVSISRGDTAQMVDVRVRVDGNYLADYVGDGLLVSTPTGSTAYNLSCGGPILAPGLSNIILTPIAPHSLTLRPLVIGSDSTLEIDLRTRGEDCHVGIDGATFSVRPGDNVLVIRRAGRRVRVVQPPGTTFGRVLRQKLKWGVK